MIDWLAPDMAGEQFLLFSSKEAVCCTLNLLTLSLSTVCHPHHDGVHLTSSLAAACHAMSWTRRYTTAKWNMLAKITKVWKTSWYPNTCTFYLMMLSLSC